MSVCEIGEGSVQVPTHVFEGVWRGDCIICPPSPVPLPQLLPVAACCMRFAGDGVNDAVYLIREVVAVAKKYSVENGETLASQSPD